MWSSISDFFYGGGSTDEPVELKDIGNADVDTVTSPDENIPTNNDFVTAPMTASLGVTQSITYTDFFPRCISTTQEYPEFDNFSSAVDQANEWLTANPQFFLFKCESVRKKILDGPRIEFDNVLHHVSSNGKNYFLNGLRLWLKRNNPTKDEPSQQIGCFQSVPWLKNDYALNNSVSYKLNSDKFLNLSQKIEALNASLKSHPLPGSIITVETVTLRSSAPLEFPGWSPQRSCWVEDGVQPVSCVMIIRIFYTIGEPALETIGIKDFIPKITKAALTSMSKPIFQQYSDVIKEAKMWLQDNKDTQVVNIQSTVSKMEQKNSGKAVIHRNSMIYREKEGMNMYLKLLSVFYVKRWKVEKISRVDLKDLNLTRAGYATESNASSGGSAKVHKAHMVSYSEVVTSPSEAVTSSEKTLTSPSETMTSPSETMTSQKNVTSPSESVTSQKTVISPTETMTSSPTIVDNHGICASEIPCFTQKVFAACRRGPKSFESFSRTVDRASYWIKCTKAPVMFLESTESIFSENMYGDGVKSEQVLTQVNRDVGRYFLTSLSGYFSEPTEEVVLEQMKNPYVQIGETKEAPEGHVV